jgi:hypothetical protein
MIAFFTFGQSHIHKVNGKIFDRNCVVKLDCPDPRAEMHRLFGPAWSMHYSPEEITPEFMSHFPRGVIEI